ncbi:hypothetical protein L9F63_016003, partial [Diploptera punctata]
CSSGILWEQSNNTNSLSYQIATSCANSLSYQIATSCANSLSYQIATSCANSLSYQIATSCANSLSYQIATSCANSLSYQIATSCESLYYSGNRPAPQNTFALCAASLASESTRNITSIIQPFGRPTDFVPAYYHHVSTSNFHDQ